MLNRRGKGRRSQLVNWAGKPLLSEPRAVMDVFREAVSVVFGEWRALQLAVEQQFGGPDSREKAQWLEAVTVDFLRDNGQVYEVETVSEDEGCNYCS